MAFAGFELLLLGAALAVYARHATDCETITLAGRELAIEHRCGVGVASARFRAEWVRVEPARGDGSLVEVSGEGQRTCVGRYLRPEWRRQLAQELRLALRPARLHHGSICKHSNNRRSMDILMTRQRWHERPRAALAASALGAASAGRSTTCPAARRSTSSTCTRRSRRSPPTAVGCTTSC